VLRLRLIVQVVARSVGWGHAGALQSCMPLPGVRHEQLLSDRAMHDLGAPARMPRTAAPPALPFWQCAQPAKTVPLPALSSCRALPAGAHHEQLLVGAAVYDPGLQRVLERGVDCAGPPLVRHAQQRAQRAERRPHEAVLLLLPPCSLSMGAPPKLEMGQPARRLQRQQPLDGRELAAA